MLSDVYRAQLVEMHQAGGRPWGQKGFRHADAVLRFFEGCNTILDYGSGKGTLREKILQRRPGTDVRNYDPGVPGDDVAPGPADLVACTDVLEHIEPDHLAAVLDHIFTLAQRRIYLQIALIPAKQVLPDGRNAHLIIQPAAWWLQQFRRRGWKVVNSEVGSKTMLVLLETVR